MKSKIMIESKQLEIVKSILEKYLPTHSKVWVFGSRVKGNVKKFSDLDLAIDSNGSVLSLEILADLMHEFDESDLPYKVDVVDLNRIDESFKNLIAQDCISLWEKN